MGPIREPADALTMITAVELEPQVVAAVRAGDVIMVKASAGSRMGPIVKALVRRHSFATAPEPVRVQG